MVFESGTIMFMTIFRKFMLWLTSAAFNLVLLSTATVFAVVLVFGSPDQIKTSLNDSQIYDKFVSGLVDSLKPPKDADITIVVDEPAITQAANAAFSAKDIQRHTESIIDSLYRWLEGDTPDLDFKIDLTSNIQVFADNLQASATSHIDSLPLCTTAQEASLISDAIDPFTLDCKPASLSTQNIANQLVESVSGGEGFLSDPVFTVADLQNEAGESPFVNARSLTTTMYRYVKSAPYVLVGTVLALAALLVIEHKNKRGGLGIVAGSLVSSGIFLLVGTWIFDKLLSLTNQAESTDVFQNAMSSVATSLNAAFGKVVMITGGLYIIIGVTLFVVRFAFMPKKPDPAMHNELAKHVNNPKKS